MHLRNHGKVLRLLPLLLLPINMSRILIAFTHPLSARASSFTFSNRLYHPMATSTIKGGYWLSELAKEFPLSQISRISQNSPMCFTHLFYASVVPNPENNYQLLITATDELWMKSFTDTVHEGPQRKALLSIGGHNFCPPSQNDTSRIFSSMASSDRHRNSFISSSIAEARNFGFDGLELDWEYPSTQQDMEYLKLLLQEWRAAIDAEAVASEKPKLLLSAAVYFQSIITIGESRGRSYPVNVINSSVDFVGARCYDYHGSWDTAVTGKHSCLRDPNHPQLNTEHGVKTWLEAGLSAQKLVMGLPLYGKTWKLADPTQNGVGAPAVGVGPGHNGIMPYHEIVQFIAEHKTHTQYDPMNAWLYAWAGTDWIGYHNGNTIKKKVEFARIKNLGGYFLWALGYDHNDSLTKAASDAWDGNAIAP